MKKKLLKLMFSSIFRKMYIMVIHAFKFKQKVFYKSNTYKNLQFVLFTFKKSSSLSSYAKYSPLFLFFTILLVQFSFSIINHIFCKYSFRPNLL